MNWKALFKDFRIWILIIALLISIVAIGPHYVQNGDKLSLGTNLKYGLDLQGGSRILVKPTGNATTEDMEAVIQTLQTRISAFGLKEAVIRPVTSLNEWYVQLDVADTNVSELKKLIEEEGNFEARISILAKNAQNLLLGQEKYLVFAGEDYLDINNNTYVLNDTFSLSSGNHNISLKVVNFTQEGAVLSTLAFSGADIEMVLTDVQHSRVYPQGSGWRFEFQTIIKKGAAERFKDITQALEVVLSGEASGNAYLNANLELYLDGKLMDSLRIGSEFKKDIVTSPSISGGAETKDAAVTQMKYLRSILQNRLPVPISIVSVSTISPALGKYFIRIALLSILASILTVGTIIFIRYRKPSIAIPVIITGLSEVIIIFGIAALIKWTLDLPSIAGIIAAIGTGVDDQIVITDERNKQEKEVRSIRSRLKRAFFIIFTAFFTTVAAMLPLSFVGAGSIKGFAITTIIGVTIGVLITRPAYARVLEHLDEK